MHNAESKTKELRQRKFNRYSKKKMVGSGNEESIDQGIALELLELDSDDDISEDLDTKHLIVSPLPDVKIKKLDESDNLEDDENVWSMSISMFIPFLLAGFGMVAASLLLDVVQVNIVRMYI